MTNFHDSLRHTLFAQRRREIKLQGEEVSLRSHFLAFLVSTPKVLPYLQSK